ncbi:MAG: hypothetical protein ACRDKG_02565 [Actinomycetota bacterium]
MKRATGSTTKTSFSARLRRFATAVCSSAIMVSALGNGAPGVDERLTTLASGGIVHLDSVPKPSHAPIESPTLAPKPSAKPSAAAAAAGPAVHATKPKPKSSPKPPPAPTPTGSKLYAANSFWNTKIPSSPAIDPNSAAIVQASLVAYDENANFANTDSWGIAIVKAGSGSKTYSIGCTHFDCDKAVSFRIPAGAKPTTGSDAHLVVIDGSKELDMWRAEYNPSTDKWTAGSRYVTNAYGWGAICGLGQHCNGAVASGFAAFGGIPRPEEFKNSVIPHALTITSPFIRDNFIACPATHTDGDEASTSAIPQGARIQLDPSFNVSAQSWPSWKKVIARTLQVYGAYVSDTGGTLAIRGESDVNRPGAWAKAGIPEGANLSDLPWNKMRVLKLKAC